MPDTELPIPETKLHLYEVDAGELYVYAAPSAGAALRHHLDALEHGPDHVPAHMLDEGEEYALELRRLPPEEPVLVAYLDADAVPQELHHLRQPYAPDAEGEGCYVQMPAAEWADYYGTCSDAADDPTLVYVVAATEYDS